MQVAIDWDLCVGSGLCVAASAGAFALAKAAGGQRAVLSDATRGDEAIAAAARACPTLAIRLRRGGRTVYPPGPGGPSPDAPGTALGAP